MSPDCPKWSGAARETSRRRVNLAFHFSFDFPRVFGPVASLLLCVGLCGMLSGLVRATVGAATFTLVRLPGGLRVGGGGGGGEGGADVRCCQPTRSLQSCSRAEVEVMMLPPATNGSPSLLP